jgi:hypothetical protein
MWKSVACDLYDEKNAAHIVDTRAGVKDVECTLM